MRSTVNIINILAFFIVIFNFYGLQKLEAHPVIYKNGTVFQSEQNNDMSEFNLHYTFSTKSAVGIMYLKENANEFTFARFNYKLYRNNHENGQANVYLGLAAGLERESLKSTSAQLYEVDADWENRDYYVAALYRQIQRANHAELSNRSNLNHLRFRSGLAPYRGEYDTLNTWFILQFDRHNDNQWQTTPLMRTYYKNILWEIGANLNGSYQLNLMFHI